MRTPLETLLKLLFPSACSYLTPQYPIQDEEKEHTGEIGCQVTERTVPARNKQLGQFQHSPIAEGEEERIDIGFFETGPKGEIEYKGGDEISNKVGNLIPIPP